MSSLRRRQDNWTTYWSQSTQQTSSFPSGLGTALSAHWRRLFGHRPLQHVDVLDVCTGNGALPHLLMQHRPAGSWRCEAVDWARSAPRWASGLGLPLHFHGGVPVEDLPFADASFDWIVSQYGIEYTDLNRTLPELKRVLRPGGALAFVLHHADSLPVALAATEDSHIQDLTGADGLLDLGQRMTAWLAMARTADGRAALESNEQAEACRSAFNACQDRITALMAHSNCPDVLAEARDWVSACLQTALAGHAEQAAADIGRYRASLMDGQFRLRELMSHALNEGGVQRVASALEALQLGPVRWAPLLDEGRLMGWQMSAGPWEA